MSTLTRTANDNGWIVRLPNGKSQKFLDSDYDRDRKKSRKAAKDALEPEPRVRRTETKVRTNKKSLNIVGITYYKVKDKTQTKHRFAVCNPNTNRPQMVHIGNDNTYERNWDRKLEEAIALRERFQNEHKG